jgi:predicted kinase
VASPALIVVSGPPGSGKTTLAHALARAVPCPAICRDEIKDGLVHAGGNTEFLRGDAGSRRAFKTFFDALRLYVSAGVTVVAEAAFQDQLWRPGLEPLIDLAEIRIIHCVVEAALSRERIARRMAEDTASRASHFDRELLDQWDSGKSSFESFQPVSIAAPSLRVDTSVGYDPDLAHIIDFVNQR